MMSVPPMEGMRSPDPGSFSSKSVKINLKKIPDAENN
jgi:hypothetical protein